MFIHTETTPNPATLKFLPGKPVLPEGTLDMRDVKAAERSPLALALFDIEGVTAVFYGTDFVTVTKSENTDWQGLKPAVLGTIMEHFTSGAPLLVLNEASGSDGEETDEFFSPDDIEIVDTIKDLIETRVRPAVAADGGDITFRGFREGTVYLAMKGSCQGCPSSTATLKHGIQNLLQHFIPEVHAVEQI
jgi:Fe-S cluster biogenesis protein NfuA